MGGLSGPQPPYLCNGGVTLRADPGGPRSEPRRWCQESTEPGRCCLSGLFFLHFRSRGRKQGAGSGCPGLPWECKSQRQRLGPGRPEGQATGFLFFFEQMVKPPDACLSGHVSTVPGNPCLSLPVTLLSSLLISGALVTFQCLGIFLQGSQTSKSSANRIQGDP